MKKFTYRNTNNCDFINTTYNISKTINENMNILNDKQCLEVLLYNFKPELSFSIPHACLMDCNKHCKIDYHTFVYGKIKNHFFR